MSITASAAATGGGRATGVAAAGTGLGFCRVTIVAPDSRIDVALSDDIPVVDLSPEILRPARQTPAEGDPVGYHLVHRDGAVLDGDLRTLRPSPSRRRPPSRTTCPRRSPRP